MNMFFIAFGCACFAVMFVASGIPIQMKIWIHRRMKSKIKGHINPLSMRLRPFDCEMCMGWWAGIISGIYFGKETVETIYIGAMAFVFSIAITKYLNK